jgi:hypothetical protein
MNAHFRNAADLRPGDVILCHCDPTGDVVAKAIHQATSSEYCHAAVYYGNSLAAESRAKDGIKKGHIEKCAIEDLLARYDHVAVLRQPDAWASDDRVRALQQFIDKVIENGARYNLSGVVSYGSRKELHQADVHEKLAGFFEGKVSPASPFKDKYFCSEFVCDCFIAVGFIQPSAAVLVQSDTYAPGDLGRESAFGTFWGYLTAKKDHVIRDTDYFFHAATYDEIFGA